MQGIMELGILTVPVTEKSPAPEPVKSGGSFSEALEKASEATDESPRADGKTNRRAAAPEGTESADRADETEETKDAADPEEAETEQPAEMLTMDLLFGTNPELSPAAESAATPIAADMAVRPETSAAPADSADILPAETGEAAEAAVSEQAEAAEAAVSAAAGTERQTAADFVKNIRERLEQELAEAAETPQEPAAETVSGPETAERRGAETRSGGSDDFSGLSGSRGSETDVEAAPELQTVQTFANAAKFAAEVLTAKLEPAELAQAIGRAADSLAADLQSIDISPAEITIALDPEDLGSISITISSDENHLTAKIVTDNKEAADLISAQMDHYLQTMQQKGIQVEKAEVVYSQLDQDGHGGNGQGREPGRQRAGEFRIDGIEGVGQTEDAEPEPPAAGAGARDTREAAADYAAGSVSLPGYRI